MVHRGAMARLVLGFCVLAAFGALAPAIAGAATITPNILTDEDAANANCSLREAITAANTDGDHNGCNPGGANDVADTIVLQSGQTYSLSLPGVEDANATGDLDVAAEPVTIQASGAAQATIDGNGDGVGDPVAATGDRILDYDPLLAGGVTNNSLTSLALTDGGDGAIRTGGAVSTLSITGSRLFANNSVGGFGAIRQSGAAITITDTSIDGNTSTGGAIFQELGSLVISGSTISGNTATGETDIGGAIAKSSGNALTLTNSTVSGNSANGGGGGIWQNAGMLNLRNATVAGNTADSDAGGLAAGDGGGVFNTGTGAVNARNSLLGDNRDLSGTGNVHPDCSGTLTGQGYNLVESTTGCTLAGVTTGNVTGVDGGLLALAANGGPTMTQALDGPTSPAIDAGNPATPDGLGTSCPSTDQRGLGRGGNTGDCDIGAYELQQQAPVLPAIGNRTVQAGQTLAFSTAAFDANPGDTLIYSAFPLPAGATLNSASGAFSWTPTAAQAGSYPDIQFSVGDGTTSDSETVTLTVTAAPVTTPAATKPKAKKCKKKKKGKTGSAAKKKKCKKKRK